MKCKFLSCSWHRPNRPVSLIFLAKSIVYQLDQYKFACFFQIEYAIDPRGVAPKLSLYNSWQILYKFFPTADVEWIMHCKPGEVYTLMKTASCESGPGTMRTWSLKICLQSFLIHKCDDGWAFPNSIYLPCPSIIFTRTLKMSNCHFTGLCLICIVKASLAWLEPKTYGSGSSHLTHYTTELSYD